MREGLVTGSNPYSGDDFRGWGWGAGVCCYWILGATAPSSGMCQPLFKHSHFKISHSGSIRPLKTALAAEPLLLTSSTLETSVSHGGTPPGCWKGCNGYIQGPAGLWDQGESQGIWYQGSVGTSGCHFLLSILCRKDYLPGYLCQSGCQPVVVGSQRWHSILLEQKHLDYWGLGQVNAPEHPLKLQTKVSIIRIVPDLHIPPVLSITSHVL